MLSVPIAYLPPILWLGTRDEVIIDRPRPLITRQGRLPDADVGCLTRHPGGREISCALTVGIATVIAHSNSSWSANRVHDPVLDSSSPDTAIAGSDDQPLMALPILHDLDVEFL